MKWDRTAALTSVIVLGALGVGTAISTHLPKADDVIHAPFIVQGVVGKPVKLRTGELVVLGVDGSTVVTSPLDRAISKNGVFVVIRLRWTPSLKPQGLDVVEVMSASGRLYGDEQAVQSRCNPAQTGIPLTCQLVFEMPPSEVPGATLLVPSELSGVTGGDLEAHIALGATDESVKAWTARTDPIDLPGPKAGTTP